MIYYVQHLTKWTDPKGPLQVLSYVNTICKILEKLMYKPNLPKATASERKKMYKSTHIHELVLKLDCIRITYESFLKLLPDSQSHTRSLDSAPPTARLPGDSTEPVCVSAIFALVYSHCQGNEGC